MISQNDPCFHFYVPQSFQGKTFAVKLRIRDEYELEQEYFIKQSAPRTAPVRESTQSLLRQPVSELLTEIAIEQMELQEEEPVREVIPSGHNLLINKYTPQKFSELLSEERINREVLMWLQVWKQKDKKVHHFFRSAMQQYDNPLNMKMANQFLLLAGPPGTGKTTLARVIGTMCGYHCNEINASDERTADKLIDRMEMMT